MSEHPNEGKKLTREQVEEIVREARAKRGTPKAGSAAGSCWAVHQTKLRSVHMTSLSLDADWQFKS